MTRHSVRAFWEGNVMLEPNRQFERLLRDKGYDVHYEEKVGGQDYLRWRATLAEGLQHLLAR